MRMVTDRLVLRRWNPADEQDVAAAFELYRRDDVTRWLGPDVTSLTSTDEALAALESWHSVEHDRPGLGHWAFSTLVDRVPIGTVLLQPLTDGNGVSTDDIEIGWHLHPDHQGHGFATEAAARLIEHAWELEIDEVNALIDDDNLPSQAVAARLGLIEQGLTDRWHGRQLQWWLLGAPLSPAA